MRKLWHYSNRNLFSPIGMRTKFFGGSSGGNTSTTVSQPQFSATPEPVQQQQALGTWGNWLQQNANTPGYGAIQPDWSSIWNNASSKINQSYYGSPTGGGALQYGQSALAANNASESPGAQADLAGQVGASYGNAMQTEAANEAVQQTNIENQGLTNWLQSIQSLANYTTPGTWQGGTQTTTNDTGTATALGNLGAGAVSLLNAPAGSTSNNWLSSIGNSLGGLFGTTQGSLLATAAPEADMEEATLAALGL